MIKIQPILFTNISMANAFHHLRRRPATCSLLQIYGILELLSTHSLPLEALESSLLVQFVLINDNLLRNQSIWESKIDDIEEREKKLLKLKDNKIEELEEQLRTLMESLEAANVEEQKSTGQHPTTSTELKDEIVAEPTDSSTKGATKMTARGKSKG